MAGLGARKPEQASMSLLANISLLLIKDTRLGGRQEFLSGRLAVGAFIAAVMKKLCRIEMLSYRCVATPSCGDCHHCSTQNADRDMMQMNCY